MEEYMAISRLNHTPYNLITTLDVSLACCILSPVFNPTPIMSTPTLSMFTFVLILAQPVATKATKCTSLTSKVRAHMMAHHDHNLICQSQFSVCFHFVMVVQTMNSEAREKVQGCRQNNIRK
jgi:hypothetical protein